MNKTALILFIFICNLVSSQVNLSTYGVVGNGIADDTAAINTALDSGGNLFANEGSVFLISGTINLDQSFSHFIDWNNSKIITNSALVPMILINKRSSNGGLTSFKDLEVDGNEIATRGITIQSIVNFDNVNANSFFQTTSTSPSGFLIEIYNDNDVYGEWIFNNCEIHSNVGDSNDELTDSWGAANGLLMYWKALPTQSVSIKWNGGSIHDSWGEDAGLFYVLDQTSTSLISGSSSFVEFDGVNFYDSERRSIKGFSGNLYFKNCNFTDPSPSNPNIQRATKSGLVVLGGSAYGNYNYLIENCTINSTGYDGRLIPANANELVINNTVFTGGADLAFNLSVGNASICSNEFQSGSGIYDYNVVSDLGDVLIGLNNTGESGYITLDEISYSLTSLTCESETTPPSTAEKNQKLFYWRY